MFDGMVEVIAAIPRDAWLALAIGMGFTIAFGYLPHMRQAWHRRRLDRRLARDSYILAEELREYERAIGDEPPELEWRKLLPGALWAGILLAMPFALSSDLALLQWDGFLFAISCLAIVYGLWRRLNDPEPEDEHEAGAWWQRSILPREALTGFICAIGAVAILLLLIVAF